MDGIDDIATTRVLQVLRERGWTAKTERPDFVVKEFTTAVGIKAASAWCTRDSTQGSHWISGNYISEGDNALANCIGFIPKDADDEAIVAATLDFDAKACKAVRQTYAMKLMWLMQEGGAADSEQLLERPRN